MDQSQPILSREEIEQLIRQRAITEEAFRAALKSTPRALLEREYPTAFAQGVLSTSKTIHILEEDEKTTYLVLLSPSSQLSDAALESVQGGAGLGGIVKKLRRKEDPGSPRGTQSACDGGPPRDTQGQGCVAWR